MAEDAQAMAEHLARVALGAVEAGDWLRFASLVSRVRAQTFQDMYLSGVRSSLSSRVTAENLRETRPDMPEEVAAFYAEMEQKGQEAMAQRLQRIGVDPDEFALLSPTEVLAFYLRTETPGLRTHWPIEATESHRGTRAFSVVGSVLESENVVHVVYGTTLTVDGEDFVRPGLARILTFEKGPEGWKLRLELSEFLRPIESPGPQLAQPLLQRERAEFTPARIFETVLRAAEAERWADIASLVDPGRLRRFREEEMFRLSGTGGWPTTREELIASTPDAPDSVIEYELEELQQFREAVGEEAFRMLTEATWLADLEQLSDAEFFAERLCNRDPRTRHKQFDGSSDRPWDPPPPLVMDCTQLGTVAEGATTVHMVYRLHWHRRSQNVFRDATRVMTVRNGARGWTVLLPMDAFEPVSDGFLIGSA